MSDDFLSCLIYSYIVSSGSSSSPPNHRLSDVVCACNDRRSGAELHPVIDEHARRSDRYISNVMGMRVLCICNDVNYKEALYAER